MGDQIPGRCRRHHIFCQSSGIRSIAERSDRRTCDRPSKPRAQIRPARSTITIRWEPQVQIRPRCIAGHDASHEAWQIERCPEEHVIHPKSAPNHLPLNPVGYLTVAIDSVAPLLRIRSLKGAAGGGAALQIPVPLGLRQRRRQAVQWILDAANKKKSRGSGRGQFAQRFADEIISVVEGKSSVWEKRMLVHRTGTSARANLMKKTYRKRI